MPCPRTPPLTMSAANGRALAIVRSGRAPGPVTVTATSAGLRPASTVIRTTGGTPGAAATPMPVPVSPVPVSAVPAAPEPASADASYSGAPGTVPAAMLDGDTTSGGWSDHYDKAATALLPAVSLARPHDWVSVSWPAARTFGTVQAYFTVGAGRALPAGIGVSYLRGGRYVPVRHLTITWAAGSDQPTTIAFDSVRSTSV